MTGDALLALLANGEVSQREKLEQLRRATAAIRALDDAAFTSVMRAIKKRLASPKLADEVGALVHAVSAGRATRPVEAARAEAPPVPWIGSVKLDATAHAIEAAIAADPEAQAPYTVLGDYWASIGDPRGELVAIGHALAKNPTHKVMRTAWTAWMEAHAHLVWGPDPLVTQCLQGIDWYMGFIRAFELFASRHVEPAEVLGVLLDDPAPARFVQRMTVRAAGDAITAALARRPRPTLRTLALGNHGYGLGDLSPLWRAMTGLRVLRLEGCGATLGDIHAPVLERFTFDFGYVVDDGQPIAFLAPLWDAAALPALHTLALTNCIHTDALCEALVRSPLAGQLVKVDLGHGTMTGVGAAVLAVHAARFPRVTRWDFELNYLDTAACALLRGALPGEVILGDQRADDGGRHGADWE